MRMLLRRLQTHQIDDVHHTDAEVGGVGAQEIGGGKDKVSLLTCLVASVIKTIISRGDAFSLEKLVQMGGLHPDQNAEAPEIEPVEVTFTVAGEGDKKMTLANPDDAEASG